MGWGILMTGLTMFGLLALVLAEITTEDTPSSEVMFKKPQKNEDDVKQAA
jgi:hypothetical protein